MRSGRRRYRNATVRFVDRATEATLCSAGSIDLLAASDTGTGTVACDWVVDLAGAASTSVTVGIVVGGAYARNAPAEDTVVTVSSPLAGTITGGGYLVATTPAGTVAADTGVKTDFGIAAKYNRAATTFGGHANAIVRSKGRVYQVKTVSITSVGADPPTGRAQVIARAAVHDVTDPSAPLAIDADATLQLDMVDAGEPGTLDRLGVTVWAGNGALWFSSHWSGAATEPSHLAGGNLAVR